MPSTGFAKQLDKPALELCLPLELNKGIQRHGILTHRCEEVNKIDGASHISIDKEQGNVMISVLMDSDSTVKKPNKDANSQLKKLHLTRGAKGQPKDVGTKDRQNGVCSEDAKTVLPQPMVQQPQQTQTKELKAPQQPKLIRDKKPFAVAVPMKVPKSVEFNAPDEDIDDNIVDIPEAEDSGEEHITVDCLLDANNDEERHKTDGFYEPKIIKKPLAMPLGANDGGDNNGANGGSGIQAQIKGNGNHAIKRVSSAKENQGEEINKVDGVSHISIDKEQGNVMISSLMDSDSIINKANKDAHSQLKKLHLTGRTKGQPKDAGTEDRQNCVCSKDAKTVLPQPTAQQPQQTQMKELKVPQQPKLIRAKRLFAVAVPMKGPKSVEFNAPDENIDDNIVDIPKAEDSREEQITLDCLLDANNNEAGLKTDGFYEPKMITKTSAMLLGPNGGGDNNGANGGSRIQAQIKGNGNVAVKRVSSAKQKQGEEVNKVHGASQIIIDKEQGNVMITGLMDSDSIVNKPNKDARSQLKKLHLTREAKGQPKDASTDDRQNCVCSEDAKTVLPQPTVQQPQQTQMKELKVPQLHKFIRAKRPFAVAVPMKGPEYVKFNALDEDVDDNIVEISGAEDSREEHITLDCLLDTNNDEAGFKTDDFYEPKMITKPSAMLLGPNVGGDNNGANGGSKIQAHIKGNGNIAVKRVSSAKQNQAEEVSKVHGASQISIDKEHGNVMVSSLMDPDSIVKKQNKDANGQLKTLYLNRGAKGQPKDTRTKDRQNDVCSEDAKIVLLQPTVQQPQQTQMKELKAPQQPKLISPKRPFVVAMPMRGPKSIEFNVPDEDIDDNNIVDVPEEDSGEEHITNSFYELKMVMKPLAMPLGANGGGDNNGANGCSEIQAQIKGNDNNAVKRVSSAKQNQGEVNKFDGASQIISIDKEQGNVMVSDLMGSDSIVKKPNKDANNQLKKLHLTRGAKGQPKDVGVKDRPNGVCSKDANTVLPQPTVQPPQQTQMKELKVPQQPKLISPKRPFAVAVPVKGPKSVEFNAPDEDLDDNIVDILEEDSREEHITFGCLLGTNNDEEVFKTDGFYEPKMITKPLAMQLGVNGSGDNNDANGGSEIQAQIKENSNNVVKMVSSAKQNQGSSGGGKQMQNVNDVALGVMMGPAVFHGTSQTGGESMERPHTGSMQHGSSGVGAAMGMPVSGMPATGFYQQGGAATRTSVPTGQAMLQDDAVAARATMGARQQHMAPAQQQQQPKVSRSKKMQ